MGPPSKRREQKAVYQTTSRTSQRESKTLQDRPAMRITTEFNPQRLGVDFFRNMLPSSTTFCLLGIFIFDSTCLFQLLRKETLTYLMQIWECKKCIAEVNLLMTFLFFGGKISQIICNQKKALSILNRNIAIPFKVIPLWHNILIGMYAFFHFQYGPNNFCDN